MDGLLYLEQDYLYILDYYIKIYFNRNYNNK